MRNTFFLIIFGVAFALIIIACQPEIETCYLEASYSPMQLEITGPGAISYCTDFINENSDFLMKGNSSANPITCEENIDAMTVTIRDPVARYAESDYMCNWLTSGAKGTPAPFPTNTPYSLPTQTYPTAISSNNSCTLWSDVSVADVGKTLCVYGTARNSWYSEAQQANIFVFSKDPKDIYFIKYGYIFPDPIDGKCVMVTGKISKAGNTPVIYIPENGEVYKCD